MEIGQAIQRANLPSKPDSKTALTHSPGSRQVMKADFAKAMAHLCALKRTSDFTDLQVTTWYGGLSTFPVWIINRSVLVLATSQERFPEFGDVYQLCRREAIQAGLIQEPYSPHGGGDDKRPTISRREISTIGEALGLAIKP